MDGALLRIHPVQRVHHPIYLLLYAQLIGELENGVWKSIGMVSKARFTAAGLITDKQYSFRVAAVGRIGEGL